MGILTTCLSSLLILGMCLATAAAPILPAFNEPDCNLPPAVRPTIDQLGWLAGGWSGKDGETETEENWIEPKGGIMLGVNRTVRSNGKTAFEFMRLADTGTDIVYFASPGGSPATPFKLIRLEGESATFENPDNEFPQRIIYRRDGDSLHARIEGKINGQERSKEWNWKRTGETRK